MKCNVGGWDRALRLVSGISALSFGLFGPLQRRGRALALGIGAIQLFTGLTRHCPLNRALGVNTCEFTTRVGKRVSELM